MIRSTHVSYELNDYLSEDSLESIYSNPTFYLKPLKKDSFRKSIVAEDLSDYVYSQCREIVHRLDDEDQTLVTGIFVTERPIWVLDTYNPLAAQLQHLIDNNKLTISQRRKFKINLYENPEKARKADGRLKATIIWLTVINRGITEFARKQLATYICQTFVQTHLIHNAQVLAWLEEADSKTNEYLLEVLKEEYDEFIRYREVFFHDNSLHYQRMNYYHKELIVWQDWGVEYGEQPEEPIRYTSEKLSNKEKSLIVRKYLALKVKHQKQELITASIQKLKEQDNIVKLSDKRISSVAGIPRPTVQRIKTLRHKRAIRKANVTRYFKTEKAAHKFVDYLNGYETYATMTMTDIAKQLSISKTDVTKFRTLAPLYI